MNKYLPRVSLSLPCRCRGHNGIMHPGPGVIKLIFEHREELGRPFTMRSDQSHDDFGLCSVVLNLSTFGFEASKDRISLQH